MQAGTQGMCMPTGCIPHIVPTLPQTGAKCSTSCADAAWPTLQQEHISALPVASKAVCGQNSYCMLQAEQQDHPPTKRGRRRQPDGSNSATEVIAQHQKTRAAITATLQLSMALTAFVADTANLLEWSIQHPAVDAACQLAATALQLVMQIEQHKQGISDGPGESA